MIKYLILLCLLVSSFAYSKGFVAGTLVKTSLGLRPIQDIRTGDIVFNADHDGFQQKARVLATYSHYADDPIIVTLGDKIIGTEGDQEFYSVLTNDYECADKLEFEPYEGEEEFILYGLAIEGYPNYFVTEFEILVHNEAAIVMTTAMAAASVSAPLVAPVAGAVIVAAVAYATWKDYKDGKAAREHKAAIVKKDSEDDEARRKEFDTARREKKAKDEAKKAERQKAYEEEQTKDHTEAIKSGKLVFKPAVIRHMFGKREGHYWKDSFDVRKKFTDIFKEKYKKGPDMHNKYWYYKDCEDGQRWFTVKEGNVVQDGGINEIPRKWNDRTGLSNR